MCITAFKQQLLQIRKSKLANKFMQIVYLNFFLDSLYKHVSD